jgi:hypothetical protein
MAILAADLPGQDDAGRLADVLYSRCYMHSILDPPAAAHEGTIDRDLTSLLIAANASRAAWDEGWRIDQILDEGRILARKSGAARSFLPGEYLTHRSLGAGPEAGKPVSIFLPGGSADMQLGLYHAFGDTAGEFEDSEQILRFYWIPGGTRRFCICTRDIMGSQRCSWRGCIWSLGIGSTPVLRCLSGVWPTGWVWRRIPARALESTVARSWQRR